MSRAGRPARTLTRRTRLTVLALLVGCATGKPTAEQLDAVRSHVYPLPVDNVLAQAATLVEKKGWAVKRVGNALLTNWLGGETGAFVAYRVYGESVSAGLCSIRVERLVATRETFNTDHPLTVDDRDSPVRAIHPGFEGHAVDQSAVGTAPGDNSNWSDAVTRAQVVVTQRRRDAEMELELQQEIDPLAGTATAHAPPPEALAKAGVPAPPPTAQALRVAGAAGPAAPATPRTERKLTELAGIWEGIFLFRGNVQGSYAGEIAVTVDEDAAEVADFCPDRGGTLTARGSGDDASWQGDLACPPIPLKGCTAAAIRYNFAKAMLNGERLTMVAAGNVELPAGCVAASSGALSVTFEAQKAHYLFLSVTRTKERTACEWPSDWEDLASSGSMAMPDPPLDANAYLGIIRAKGARLGDIEVLLRHCRHRVLLHGQPVSMRLAVMGPHRNALR